MFSCHSECTRHQYNKPQSGRSNSTTAPSGGSFRGSPSFCLHTTVERRKGASAWRQIPACPTSHWTCSWSKSLELAFPITAFPSYLWGPWLERWDQLCMEAKFSHMRKTPTPLRNTHYRLVFWIIFLRWDYIFLFVCHLQIPKPTGIHLKTNLLCFFLWRRRIRKVWPCWTAGNFVAEGFGLVFIFLVAGPANRIPWRSHLILQRQAT